VGHRREGRISRPSPAAHPSGKGLGLWAGMAPRSNGQTRSLLPLVGSYQDVRGRFDNRSSGYGTCDRLAFLREMACKAGAGCGADDVHQHGLADTPGRVITPGTMTWPFQSLQEQPGA